MRRSRPAAVGKFTSLAERAQRFGLPILLVENPEHSEMPGATAALARSRKAVKLYELDARTTPREKPQSAAAWLC